MGVEIVVDGSADTGGGGSGAGDTGGADRERERAPSAAVQAAAAAAAAEAEAEAEAGADRRCEGGLTGPAQAGYGACGANGWEAGGAVGGTLDLRDNLVGRAGVDALLQGGAGSNCFAAARGGGSGRLQRCFPGCRGELLVPKGLLLTGNPGLRQ